MDQETRDTMPPPTKAYPPARRVPLVQRMHGHLIKDPYRWLEDPGSADCAAWLEGQAALLATHASTWRHRPLLRELLEAFAAGGGAAVPVVSPPVIRGPRRFYLRRAAGQEMPVLMTAGAGQAPSPLLDPLALDPSALTTLDAWRPSWSGDLLAYQTSRGGDEQPALHILDVSRRRVIDGPLRPGRITPIAWLPDDGGFYYLTLAAGPFPPRRQVRLHRLGTDPDHDPVVFATDWPHLSIAISPHGHGLTISSAPGAQCGNRLWLSPLVPGREHILDARLIHDGTQAHTTAMIKFGPGGRLYAVTDADAPYGRVCGVEPADPHSSRWRTLITADEPAVLSGCVPLTGPDAQPYLLLSLARPNGAELRLYDGEGGFLDAIPAPGHGPGTITGLTCPPGGDEAYFTYSDFVTAPAVYRFGLRERRCRPWIPPTGDRQTAATGRPRGQGRAPEVTELSFPCGQSLGHLYVIAQPGRPGPRPAILTAYGGFGASFRPAYSPTTLAWVAAGGIYAVAAVRGGGEYGTTWHAAGRGINKPNAMTDFIAAARHLIELGWTTPGQLAIKGASHSGLLVAAALTRAPELFAAAVCSDAPTDLIRYPRFGLGPWWKAELGDPDLPDHLPVLLSYSPYHQVRPGTPYPAVLLTTPRTDPRVDAMHIRKFTAALQHATGSDRPVLMRCEDGVGHGLRAASRWYDLQADALAFCAGHTGLEFRSQ
ncbi:prolyl oligopeptidase family serine peptidase [Nonomuraea jabiensis]|uniref:prolyl oligopeptidase family serine peptidase n=1 Tax=Nonomuraea jabiensis TaxID=882448 RepID=UPI00343B5EA6